MGVFRFIFRVVKYLATRYPNIGRWIATGFGALETPLLDLFHFIDEKIRPGSLTDFFYYFSKIYGSRVVPIDVNLEGIHTISPTEEMKAIIRRVPALSIGWCYCRKKNQNCNTSIWTCIHIGTAKYLGDLAKKMPLRSATVEEVEDLLDTAEKRGLVHQLITAPTPDYTYVICNCCPCCCTILRNASKYRMPGVVVASSFVARDDVTKCVNCGACAERCYFGARVMKDGNMIFIPNYCYGCGLCVSACPQDVIQLIRRESSDVPSPIPSGTPDKLPSRKKKVHN